MPTAISSLQNPRVKQVVKLQNRRARDLERLTVVEGIRECVQAAAHGYWPQTAFICPEIWEKSAEAPAAAQLWQQLAARQDVELIVVTPAVFAKMAYRGDSGGILALIPYLDRPLAALPLQAPPFLVVIEGGEKPGNIGAVLRTAAAAGVNGLILSESAEFPGTDMHNPNVVRASLGAIFTVPFATAPTAEVIEWLRGKGIMSAAATPAGTKRYTAVDFTGGVALVLGSEAYGLSAAWLAAADCRLLIPMVGALDSLNSSVASALLMYEVVRQRSADAAAAN